MLSKHDHVGYMLFDTDWCGCKFPSCNQQWKLDLNKGWIPLGPGGMQAAPGKPKFYYKKNANRSSNPKKFTRPARPVLTRS